MGLTEEVLRICSGHGATANEVVVKTGASPAEVSATILELFRLGRLRQVYDKDYDPARPYETLKWSATTLEPVRQVFSHAPEEAYVLAMSVPGRVQREFNQLLSDLNALDLMTAYASYIRSAKEEILIVTPYIDDFASYPLVEALRENSDLRIRVVTETGSLSKIQRILNIYSGRVEARAIGESSNTVSGFKTLGVHMKVVVVDRKAVMVGSFNLTQTHLHVNFDVCFIFHDTGTIEKFVRIFDWLWSYAGRGQDV